MSDKIQYLPLDVEAMLQARQFSESDCLACVGLTELCPACQDLRDTRDAEIAHQIVDESQDFYYRGYGDKKVAVANGGAVSEYNPMSVIRDLISGHDWTDREGELLEPTCKLEDRFYDLETSVTMTAAEIICQDCHLSHNKHAKCPNCN
jgi:hypothetical protein